MHAQHTPIGSTDSAQNNILAVCPPLLLDDIAHLKTSVSSICVRWHTTER
jgi:hypothetical protein